MPRGVSRYDEARLQGQLWTPEYKPFTECCWDVYDLSAVTTATGVSQVADKSGRGRHMVQAGTSVQPALVSGPNGRGWGLQNGGSKYMLASATGLGSAASSIVACYVFRLDGASGILFDLRLTGNSTPLLGDGNTGGFGAWRRDDSGALVSSSNQTSDNNWNIGTVAFDGATLYSRKNGGSQKTVAATGIITLLDTVGLMTNANSPSANVPSATVGALIILNDFSLMSRLEGSLAWRWGMTNNLDPAHPFKNRPPLIGD